jgi:hypothetical protein
VNKLLTTKAGPAGCGRLACVLCQGSSASSGQRKQKPHQWWDKISVPLDVVVDKDFFVIFSQRPQLKILQAFIAEISREKIRR